MEVTGRLNEQWMNVSTHLLKVKVRIFNWMSKVYSNTKGHLLPIAVSERENRDSCWRLAT